jgi:hypothetical protein
MKKKMDAIDTEQQRLIDSLLKRDTEHDNFIDKQQKLDQKQDRELIWVKVSGILIALYAVIMTAVVFYTLQKSTPYNCPHPDCVHHRASE